MFLTETDFINAKLMAEGAMNESDIIKYILNNDISSPQKKKMQEGERYYNGEQDILQKDFRQGRILETEETGEEHSRVFQNYNRSNHKNVNAFLKILVDQKTAYLVSREPTISVLGAEQSKDLKDYETILCDFADDTFNEVLQDFVTGASNKGFESIHVYYDEKGCLQYQVVPANEVIPIYDTENEKELLEVIRYYDITVVKDGQQYTRKKVEWWTKTNVTYYIEQQKDMYVKDTSLPFNPSPHWWSVTTTLDGFEKKRQGHSWGRVPFMILKNNRNMTTDLEHIKGLIDAYDLLSSEGTNNFLDLVELYWVIAGYGGETANAIAKRLRINKAVHISDSSGKIEAKQVELPVSGRLEYLKMLRKDIFHFGMGIDVDSDKFGTAPSGVSLKFQYTLLDQKAGNMTSKLKKAIKELLWYVTEDYNSKNNTNYDANLIKVDINKNMITNDAELVSMIQASKGIVSDKTLLAVHPFVSDVNAEMQEMEAEEKRAMEQFDPYKGLGDDDEQ